MDSISGLQFSPFTVGAPSVIRLGSPSYLKKQQVVGWCDPCRDLTDQLSALPHLFFCYHYKSIHQPAPGGWDTRAGLWYPRPPWGTILIKCMQSHWSLQKHEWEGRAPRKDIEHGNWGNLKRLFVLVLLNCKNFLCRLDTEPTSWKICKYFLFFGRLPFYSLIMLLDAPRLLNLKSNLCLFLLLLFMLLVSEL